MSDQINDDKSFLTLPHGALLQKDVGVITLSLLDRMTINFDILEFIEWVQQLEEIAQIASQLIEVEVEKCEACGTITEHVILAMPVEDDYH